MFPISYIDLPQSVNQYNSKLNFLNIFFFGSVSSLFYRYQRSAFGFRPLQQVFESWLDLIVVEFEACGLEFLRKDLLAG